jgi:sigma-B regulation protein RsbU (phosphoserine phosphatase)
MASDQRESVTKIENRSEIRGSDSTGSDQIPPLVSSAARVNEPLRQAYYPEDRRMLDGFFRLSLDMLCIMGLDGSFQRLNPAFERVFGYDEQEMKAQSWLEIVHPDDWPAAADALQKLGDSSVTDEQVLSLENRCRCKDGTYRWLVWNLTADTAQQLIYAAAHDVTRRREVEEATRRTDTFLTSIVENIPHMIFVKDAHDLRFVRINKAEEEMIGLTQEQMIGKNDFDLFPGEEASFFTGADRAVLESGKLLDVPEETIHCAKGVRIFHTKKIPIFDDAGVPRYLLGISEDITEYKQAEAELRDRNARMQADLDLARAMQEAFIVEQFPRLPSCAVLSESCLSFHHRYIPDAALGGDFFHVTILSESSAAVFICDVMGHGVRSALVTAMIRALVSEKSAAAANPGAFMTQINQHLHGILEQARTPMFASAFYMVADSTSGRLWYANAGHPSPLRLRPEERRVERLQKQDNPTGPALGVFDDVVYETVTCELNSGDLFVLFTDGVFEVLGQDDEYGEERLVAALKKHSDLPVDDMFDELLSEIRDFSASGEFADDVCLVGVKVKDLTE